MCGRYTLTEFTQQAGDDFGVPVIPDLPSRHNIAPGQMAPAIVAHSEAPGRLFRFFQWGLTPSWIKDAGSCRQPINARSESVAEKPFFRQAFHRRRCLLPADGFYEWAGRGPARKPFYFHLLDKRPFAFAGLWEHWEGSNGEAIDSCVILTTSPNACVSRVHNRMPVIVRKEDTNLWLDTRARSIEDLRHVFAPYAAEEMRCVPVSQYVNNPAHDGPCCSDECSPVSQDRHHSLMDTEMQEPFLNGDPKRRSDERGA